MIKLGLSLHYRNIISGLSTMRVFHFEMSSFHKLLLFMDFIAFYRAYSRGHYLTELTWQDVGLIPPLFHCLGACFMLLFHGFVSK